MVEEGRVFLWSQPGVPAELFSDPMHVGRPRERMKIPDGARCGVVTRIGPGDQAGFTAVRDPVQALVVEALFELRRNR